MTINLLIAQSTSQTCFWRLSPLLFTATVTCNSHQAWIHAVTPVHSFRASSTAVKATIQLLIASPKCSYCPQPLLAHLSAWREGNHCVLSASVEIESRVCRSSNPAPTCLLQKWNATIITDFIETPLKLAALSITVSANAETNWCSFRGPLVRTMSSWEGRRLVQHQNWAFFWFSLSSTTGSGTPEAVVDGWHFLRSRSLSQFAATF